MTKKFRVYRYYVGCEVFDVEADSAEEANNKLERASDREKGAMFLHEASDSSENGFFTEVFGYDAEGETRDDPDFVFNPACAKIWRELPFQEAV